MLLGYARGKMGSMVFSVVKGQQVQRPYNSEPNNPQTMRQQAQRSLLANMTKFYKRGTNNFFKFAFEGRKSTESDYNAFARMNTQAGVYLSREIYDNEFAPALGTYQLTQGSILAGLDYRINGDNFFLMLRGTWSGSSATIGEASTKIMTTYPAVLPGDIVTIVGIESEMNAEMEIFDIPPYWRTVQFVIDPTDTRTITSMGLKMVGFTDGDCGLGFEGNLQAYASAGAVVISRNTDKGLLVSNSKLALSPACGMLVSQLKGAYAKKIAAISWGGNPEAYLKGGELGDITTDITSIKISGSTVTQPFAYRTVAFIKSVSQAVEVYGNNLKTTAQGGKWAVELYNANPIEEKAYEHLVVVPGTAISVTGGVSFPIYTDDIPEGQVYFVVKYNDEPICWGLGIKN